MKWLKIILLTGVWLSLGANRAVAATFQMQTGYYVGDGADTRAITGVGFQPQLVLIKDDTGNGTDGVNFKTSAMSGETSSVLGDSDADTANNAIQSLDSDGFTLGTDTDVNAASIRYIWTAYAGSDCTSSGTFCVGSYTGNGTSQSLTSVGFQSNLVAVKRSGASSAVFRTSSMGTNASQPFDGANELTDGITTLDATGFTVSSNARVNTSSNTYWFFAFKTTSNAFAVGTFTGDGADNKSITVGFQSQSAWIKNSNATTPVTAYYSNTESTGDYSSTFIDGPNATGIIKSLDSNGLTVGTGAGANENGKTIYWVAFGGATAPTTSGNFQMYTGTYTGNGTSQSISGLGFAPDLVLVKDAAGANYAVYTTRIMPADSTTYFAVATANFAGGITSLDSNGFSVGSDATVNTNSTVYHYQAFGNAFEPTTRSGAADFVIGAYTANGVDGSDIFGIPFQPDLVVARRPGAYISVVRTSNMSGDLTGFFHSAAEAADNIQAINTNGFEIGSHARINAAGVLYYFFAFKAGANFKVGSYTGNGTGQNITGPGIDPDLVWVKNVGAVPGVMRPSTLSGDSTHYFLNTAAASDRITALISTGFTVGGNQVQTNTNTTNYRYAVWNINSPSATPSLDSPADTATGQSLTPALLTTTTDVDSDYLRYKIQLCENVGMTTNCQTFDQTSSQTGWSGQNTQSSTAYTSGTQATYTIQSALTAATTYYWRSYAIDPGGTNTWSGTQTPKSFTTSAAPTVSSVAVNGGANIALTEGTTTTVNWVGTVTDTNGYATISSANGVLYRSGVSGAEVCTPSNNNCYADASCTLSGCSGNSCTATCSVDIMFFAEPTDASSSYSTEYWRGWIKGTDSVGLTGVGFSTAGSPELESMAALNVTTSITYDPLLAGDDTGASNEVTTITNTGNTIIDVELSGDDFCTDYPTCSGSQIAVGYQEYKTSAFTYGLETALTSSPVTVQINLAKATANPSNSSTTLYWGMGVPSPKAAGTYSGANLFTVVDGD